MKEKQIRKLSPANLEIMKVVWELREATINDVLEALNARRKEKLGRTTVQLQMNRLEEYGWLEHRKKGRTFYYSAAKEKQKARRDIINDIKNRVFGGSRTELVKALFDDSDIKPEEIEELWDLLSKFDKE